MRRILVINPFGIGDVLFTTPVLRALRSAYPDSFLAYLCSRSSEPVLRHNPHIQTFLLYTRGEFKIARRSSYRAYMRLFSAAARDIRRLHFDCAVDLSLVGQYSFFLWLLGVRERRGFDYRGRGRFLTHKIPLSGFAGQPVLAYYESLLRQMGIPLPQRQTEVFLTAEERAAAADFLQRSGIPANRPCLGVVPFGGGSWGPDAEKKQWPLPRFAEAARHCARRFQCAILIFGTAADRAAAEALRQAIALPEQTRNLAGTTDVRRLMAVLERCAAVVGNDSGPLHIAAALGKKTLTLFGPADEVVYGPAGDARRNQIITAAVPCRPCYRQFRAPACSADGRCLRDISVGQVIARLDELWEAVTT
ncbi:MAG: lipopolysaccharide heptosyltransferase II [Candidatus Omnitrophica bacterium]|nr:lipopolysaccharide heptosyltransferase II [Candidatus Omnitrophota bacterium]